MNRREASKIETRELILGAARSLFREKGVDQCTMRDIAREAGVSPSSIVVHFKNKTALLEVALFEDIGKAVGEALASMPVSGPLLDRLMHIPRAMFVFYDTNRDLYRALVRLTVFEPEADNPHISAQLQDYLSFLAGLIEEEKSRGTIRPDVDPEIASYSLSSLYFGVLTSFYRNPATTPEMAAGVLRAMTSQYLMGIIVEKGEEHGRNP